MAPGAMGASCPTTSTPRPRSRNTEITPPMASSPNTEPPERTRASTRSTVMSASSRCASRKPGAPPETETEAVAGASNNRAVTPVAISTSWELPTMRPRTSVMRLRMDTPVRELFRYPARWLMSAARRKSFDMTDNVTISAALLAGLLSFLSPCVLPLVPPYLTFIAGSGLEELAEGGERRAARDTTFAALLFVAGFSTVFVALGATASAVGQTVRENLPLLSAAAGVVIIGMGLHFLGVFRLTLLYREKRLEVEKPVGLWGAYVMGLAFAFGWTPCIGPILAAILAVASSEATVGKGAFLLGVYSLGLGIPFIVAALAMEPFIRFLRRFKAHFGKVERVVGALLVVTGVAFLTGGIQNMSFWLIQTFPGLATLG